MPTRTSILWLLFTLLIFTEAKAALSVRIYKPDQTDAEIRVRMNSLGSQYDLVAKEPSGSDGTIESNPVQVYIPGQGGTVARPQASLYSLNGSVRGANLPTFAIANPPNANLVIETEVTITSGEPSQHFLHAAVVNNSASNDWRVISINSTAISNGVSRQFKNISVSLNEFCDRSATFNCDDLSNSNNNISGLVYFFLAPPGLGLGSQINPKASNYAHGIYYNFNISTRAYDQDTGVDPTAIVVDLTRVVKGDEGLAAEYRVSAAMNELDRTIILYFGETVPVQIRQYLGDYAIQQVFDNKFTSALNGKILISPLPNGQDASIAVAQVDKYNYVTRISNAEVERPEAIAALLREQSCFFFTAGFQRKHPVTERLQRFRSEVLMKFDLGRRFVKFYYRIGPKYAPLVLESKPLQYFFQALGFSLVFLINNALILTSALLLFVAGFLLSRSPLIPRFAKDKR